MNPPSPLTHLFHPDHAEPYRTAMTQGLDHLLAAAGRAAGPTTGVTPEQAAAPVAAVDLDRPLGETGAALAELRSLWLDDAVWFHDPSYAAHLNCPVVVPALLAELYVSAVNASLDTFDQSVGGTFVERSLIEWTARRIGFTAGDGVFTSGGSQSNLQALLIARNRAAARGVHPERMRVLVSADGHFSVAKSAHLLGLAPEAVVTVRTDAAHRLDVGALDLALAEGLAADLVPIAVVATAGTTDLGAVDPLPEIADLAHAYGAWLHVDAAYGGGLLVSRRRRPLLDGVERADSVTVDYHKTWFQPVSSSAIIVREAAELAHVAWHADYLNPRSADPAARSVNQVDKSLQTTRRFDALKLWLTLRVTGPDTLGDYVDAVIDLAHAAHALLEGEPDLEFAAAPTLSTLVFRVTGPDLPAWRLDLLNARVRTRLWQGGRAVVASTRIEGRVWLKLTLLNPMATLDDVVGVVDRARAAGAALLGQQRRRELIP